MIDVKELEGLSLDELQDIEIQLERKRCQNDFMYLCTEIFGVKIINPAVHGDYIRELNNIHDTKSVLIHLPRGHLKSTLLVIWVFQQVIKNPQVRIAMVCSVFNLGLKLMLDFKQLVANEKIQKLFPDIFWSNTNDKACIWQNDRLIVKRKPGVAGYTIRVGSIDGEMTGEHYDILVFDDVQAKNNSQTALQINNVIEGLKNFESILEPDGAKIYIGTPWKLDDAYAWLRTELNIRTVIKGCAVNSKGEECSVLEEDAQPIYPERFTIEWLREKRRTLGAYFFSCQYECHPLPADTITFKESWFKYYYDSVPFKKFYILVDPALTKTRNSDESVISVVGQPVDNTLPLRVIKSIGLTYDITKGEIQALVDVIFDEFLYYRSQGDTLIGIEVNAFQDVLRQWIEKEQRTRKVFFEVTELKTKNRPKEARIKALQPLFENHGILFNEFNTDKLISQLIKYGAITKDDHPDALAYLLDVLEDYNIAEIKALPIDSSDLDLDEDLAMALYGERTWRDY